MNARFSAALAAGAERLTAWADLLDSINVFPVADGDTGRNLAASLIPLRGGNGDREELTRRLLLSARGNSGNISARFFSGFLICDNQEQLHPAVMLGRDRARRAVSDPKEGTILTFFDGLASCLEETDMVADPAGADGVVERLEQVVRDTSTQLPVLAEAGVVDSGALGMFIFFEAFFDAYFEMNGGLRSVARRFENLIDINPFWQGRSGAGVCVDAVLEAGDRTDEVLREITDLGDDVVTIRHGDLFKVHFHAKGDEARLRERIEGLANLVRWTSDDLGAQTTSFLISPRQQALHIMTDAAGSVTRDEARRLGITLLESYVNVGPHSIPETHLPPEDLYRVMREGAPVSTSQASVFERHQHYQSVLSVYPEVLYLCVGSVYTGNFQTVTEWQGANDPEGRLMVVDTGTASGRLGLTAIATARFSMETKNPAAVTAFAQRALERCEEYLFLDRLHYVARGGRLSKGSAFFGDLIHMKPVVSPTPEGVQKVAVLRNRNQQLRYAVDRVRAAPGPDAPSLILLQYSDNMEWVAGDAKAAIQGSVPSAEILVRPLSLTTGCHTGPGSWGVAFLPELT